jgi:hypothetical protein
MCRSCSTCDNEIYLQRFGQYLKERDHLGDLCADGRILLR